MALQGTLQIQKKQKPRYTKDLYIGTLNVLVQARRTFVDIDSLSFDIEDKGLLHALTIADLDREQCVAYLKIFNQVYDSDYAIEKLGTVRNGNGTRYRILIAGERRLRACRMAYERSKKNGGRFKGVVTTNVCEGIDPYDALSIQLSENIHAAVPLHEEAHAYARFWRLLKHRDPHLTLAAFARRVGRSPEKIRDALRFCELPEKVQDEVQAGRIHYGIAVSLAKLQQYLAKKGKEKDLIEESLERWLARVIVHSRKVGDFDKDVGAYIDELESGQQSLLDMMSANQARDMERGSRRLVVNKEMLRGLHGYYAYLESLRMLYEGGKIGKKESIFSEKSPIVVMRKVVESLERLLPHVKRFQRTGEINHYKNFVREAEKVLPPLPEPELFKDL